MFSHQINAKRRLFIAAFLIALPLPAFGNLALFSASDIQRTGNLVPIRKSAIELVHETLTVKIDAETAAVTVAYDFANTGGGDAVTVGFPVDLMPPSGEGSSYNIDHWQKDGLQNLRVIDGTTELPIERTTEETLSPQDRPKRLKDVAIKRRWSITTLHFQAREKKTVRISYVVRCMGLDTGFEGDPRWKFSPRTFLYTFRTATGWGTGRIRKLDISLDATFVRQNRFAILEMEPKLKTVAEGMWRSEFHDADLSRIPDLVFSYDATHALSQTHADSRRLLRLNWQLSMCGPGKLGADTLGDGNPQTAWMPEFPNANTCIEIKPRRDSYIQSIAILNGDQSSSAEYAKHARIKKLRVTYDLHLEEGRKHEVFEQTLPDAKFDDRVAQFPNALAHFLDLPGGPEGIIEDVKLTVLELYHGIDNAPLAISEIYVYGTNGKK